MSESSENIETGSPRSSDVFIIASLAAVCIFIYGQVWWFEFINFDDNLYVYENPIVASGLSAASIKWAFTAFHSANWHPLTWISHMIDAQIFGPNAGGHHAMNVVFHIANSILAYVVFNRLTGDMWKSAVVAFLFAVHPAHVESVAWISERKDVLSTMFWLLTMFAYVRYVRHAEDVRSIAGRMLSFGFVVVLVCFALGLMAKPMLVTLPFVLLLLDYWPLERFKARRDIIPLVLEKVPMFALAVASSYITILAQRSAGAIQSTQVLPLDTRILNAVISYAKYLGMLIYPVDLGVGYSYQFPFPVWQLVLSFAVIAGITVLCVWQYRQRKYLIVGWLWFLGTMVPVIGLVQVGAQSMADRYTYVPYFGLFVMIVWFGAEVLSRSTLNFASRSVVAAVPVAILSLMAFNQTTHWRSGISLYTHSLSSGHGNFLIMHNLCSTLAINKRFAEAEVQCRNSISADPGFPESHVLLGVVTLALGQRDVAIAEFKRAIELDPSNAIAFRNLAAPLALAGRPDEAEESLRKADELYARAGKDPADLAGMYLNLGTVFAKQNRFDKAEMMVARVLELNPARADARANYALSLYFQNKLENARVEIERTIKQDPNLAEGHNIRGLILLKQNDRSGAIESFKRSLEIRPDFQEAKENLEKANGGK